MRWDHLRELWYIHPAGSWTSKEFIYWVFEAKDCPQCLTPFPPPAKDLVGKRVLSLVPLWLFGTYINIFII